MSSLIQGKTTAENLAIKRFGYLLSAMFLVASVVAMMAESISFPWLFLITMYLLSGSLWMPKLIRPVYHLFGKYLPLTDPDRDASQSNETHDLTNTDEESIKN